MTLTDLIALLSAHNWLGLIVLLVIIARKWTGPDSKFPVTIPPTWQPTVTAAGGLVYGFVSALQQGEPAGTAVLSMVISAGTGGFLDGIMMAVFNHDNAPVWARSIVFIFDDLTGKGTPPTGAAKERVARLSSKPPPPPPAAARLRFRWDRMHQRWLVLSMSVFLSVSSAGAMFACSKLPPNTPADVENAIGCVATALLSGGDLTACVLKYGAALVADALQALLDSKDWTTAHPELVATAKTKLTELRAQLEHKP